MSIAILFRRAAVSLALSAGVAGLAQAETFTLTFAEASSPSVSIFNVITSGLATDFSSVTGITGTAGGLNITGLLTLGDTDYSGIDNLATANLLAATPSSFSGGYVSDGGIGFVTAGGEKWSLTNIGAALYQLDSVGLNITQTGTLSVSNVPTVSPVPEPETYAMLLVGLAALGATRTRTRCRRAAA